MSVQSPDPWDDSGDRNWEDPRKNLDSQIQPPSFELPDRREFRSDEIRSEVALRRYELREEFKRHCQDEGLDLYYIQPENDKSKTPEEEWQKDLYSDLPEELKGNDHVEQLVPPQLQKTVGLEIVLQANFLRQNFNYDLVNICGPNVVGYFEFAGLDQNLKRNVCLLEAVHTRQGKFIIPPTDSLTSAAPPRVDHDLRPPFHAVSKFSEGVGLIADFASLKEVRPSWHVMLTSAAFEEAVSSAINFCKVSQQAIARGKGMALFAVLEPESLFGHVLLSNAISSAYTISKESNKPEQVVALSRFKEVEEREVFQVGLVVVPLQNQADKSVPLINHVETIRLSRGKNGVLNVKSLNIHRSRFESSPN